MLLKIVQFVAFEGFIFFVMVIGAFVLSHLGLMLIGQVDALLWGPNRHKGSRSISSSGTEAGAKLGNR